METYSGNTTKKILNGTLSLTLASLLVKLIGLSYKIPLSYILTDEGMGYFNSAYTVYSFFYLISVAGVPKAITILVSECKARGALSRKRKIYSTSITAFGIFGLFSSILLCIFADGLASLIGNPLSKTTIIFIAPSILFTAVSGVVRGYLCADMKFTHIAISQILDAVIKTALGIALALYAYSHGYGLHVISAFTILGATIGTIVSTVYLILVAKISNSKEICRQNEDRIKISEIVFKVLRISLPITISAATMSMTNVIDLLLVMKRLVGLGYSTSQASILYGNYTTLVVPMLGVAGALLSPLALSVMPALASSFSSGKREEFSHHLSMAVKVTAFFAVPISLGFTFYSKEVLFLIFDDVDATVAAPILSIGASSIIFCALLSVINSALESAGVVNAPIFSMLGGCVFKILASYYLIGTESFGICGAPIGTTLCYAAALALSVYLLYRKCTIRISLLSTLLVPFINSVLAIFISKRIILNVSSIAQGWVLYVLSVVLCAILYFAFSFIFYIFYNYSKKISKNAQKNMLGIIKYDENV